MGANLRQVAERAGVSVRTVSNVVSGFPLVAPVTRERVQRVLDELGYRPNAAARHLRGGRSGLIALVVPEIASPYFSELAGELASRSQALGWTLLIQQTDGDAARERELLDGVHGQAVDAVIVSPWGLSPAELRRGSDGVPLVLLGEQDADGALDHVVVDNAAAARDMTDHLIEQGRRRIAALGTQPHLANGTAERRLEGYRQALVAVGRHTDPSLEIPVRRLHRADGADAMRRLLEQPNRPDAVFCFSDQLALGAMHVALQAGLRIPTDLAVAGFDDIEDGRYANPPLTTVSPDKPALAAAALDCVSRRLDRRAQTSSGHRTVVGHHLEIRQSSTAAG